jgi:hypothetical protein
MRTKLLLLLGFTMSAALGQTGAERAVIRTTGQYDVDGTALYSVFVASKDQGLEDLTISAALPPGTRFLETVQQPAGAIYEGVKADIVNWKVSRLEADAVLGPFVFRVNVDGTADAIPATILAAVAYQRPVAELVESPAPEGILRPLAVSGTIVVEPRGTVDAAGRPGLALIGDTGVGVFVPAGAVTQRVTLTIRRVPVVNSELPDTDPATWWCARYQISSEPEFQFTEKVAFSFPTRRAVTPGLTTLAFTSENGVDWADAGSATGLPPATVKGSERSIYPIYIKLGDIVATVNQIVVAGTFLVGQSTNLGLGFLEQDHLRGVQTGSKLTTLGSSAATSIVSPRDPAGIIAILIGL